MSVTALLLLFLLNRTRQTDFGDIKRGKMAELRDPSPVEQVVSAARKVVQLSTMDTRQRSYLKVGDSL